MQEFPVQYAQLVESLFSELQGIADSSTRSLDADTIMLKLHHIFGSMLISALQLIDKRSVTKITLPNGRSIYQVSSTSGLPYTVYPSAFPLARPYCPCIAFTQSVLAASEQLMCKHVLAARLAIAMNRVRDTQVAREAVTHLLR